MTSTTFFDKIKQGFSTFRWSLRANRAVMVVYLALIGFITVQGLVGMMSWSSAGFYDEGISLKQNFGYPVWYHFFLAAFIVPIFTFVLCGKELGYLHSKRKLDMYGSLPISRRTLFISKLIAIYLMVAVPFAVQCLVLSFLGDTSLAEHTIPDSCGLGLVWILANVCFIGLLAVCCGKFSDMVVSYIAINAAYPAAMYLIQMLPAIFLNSYRFEPSLVITTAFWPFASFLGNTLYWLIFSAVSFALSVFLIKKRKNESAQSHFAFKLPLFVIRLFVSFGEGILFAFLLMLTSAKGMEYVNFWIGMLIGSFVAFLIIQVIFAHGFRGFGKSMISYSAMIVVFAMIFSVLATGMFGYDSYVPKVDEIKSVSFNDDRQFIVDGKDVLRHTTEDRDDIAATVKEHKKLVRKAAKAGLRENLGVTSILPLIFGAEHYGDPLNITYTLKNGSKVTRSYSIYEADLFRGTSTTYICNTLEPFTVDDKYISAVRFGEYEYEEDSKLVWSKKKNSSEELKKLMSALRADIREQSYPDEDDVVVEKSIFIKYDHDLISHYDYPYTEIVVPESYKRTMEVLKGIGNKE